VRRRPITRPIHPDRQAEMYMRRVGPFLADLHHKTESAVERALRIANVISDAEGITTDVTSGVERQMAEAWPAQRLAGAVRPVGTATVKLAERNVERLTGIDAKDVAGNGRVDKWVAENVDLIRTVEDRYLEDVREMVAKGFEAGTRWETIAKRLQERAGVSKSNAERIARDQTGKLNAEVSKDTMEQLGVTRGIWRTMGDERVRDEHAELEGQEYDLATGILFRGEHIWPGSEIQCRCYCEPVLDLGKKTETQPEPQLEPMVEPESELAVEPETIEPAETTSEVWGEALRFTRTETPQAETITRDLQLVTEASPLLAKTLVDKGATLNIDLVSKSVPEAIRYSKKLKNFYEEAGQIEGMNRVVTGMVIGEKHLVIASGGGLGTESILAHEYGHVLDFKAGPKLLSGTDSWRKMWQEWTKRPDPGTTKWAHDYFLDPTTGPREAFAEVYAHAIAKGKAHAASVWGDGIVNEMISTLKSIDPNIKFGE